MLSALLASAAAFVGCVAGSTALHAQNAGRLSSWSLRTDISSPGESFTIGYTVGGTGTSGVKPVLLRAVGPSLALFGLPAFLADPKIEVFEGVTRTAENDNWSGSAVVAATTAVGAFSLPSGSLDAALVVNSAARENTMRISGNNGGTGAVLAEVYDATTSFTATTPRFLAGSVLKTVAAGQTMIVGFSIAGSTPMSVLVRAVGPTLGGAPYNLAGAMSDPQLRLYNSSAALLLANDNWIDSASASALTTAAVQVGAFPLLDSRDAALITTLAPGSYTAQVSGVGSASGLVLLEVYEVPALATSGPPVFVASPQSRSAVSGSTVQLSALAEGLNPIALQWRRNGTPISGATSMTLTLPNVSVSDNGTYDVVATNSLGTATSAAATLSVTAPVAPTISTHPVPVTVTWGGTATFSVTATGTAPLSYQWRRDTVAISGATSATYSLANVQTVVAGAYDVVVTNSAGSVTSNAANLVVQVPVPLITTQPSSVTTSAGATATFTVVASSPVTTTYQWRKGGVPITGATNSSLIFSNVTPAANGNYDVVITNVGGSVTSNTATLTVNAFPPTILTQPVGATIGVGANYTLSVTTSGSPTLTYQWRLNGVPLPTATAATLALINAQTSLTGDLDVVVTNPYGTATSNRVRLDVVPRPIALSARLVIGNEPTLGLFTIEGSAPKPVLLRVVGPGLAPFGFPNLLVDPQLEIFNSSGALIAANNDWGAAPNAAAIVSTTAAVGAFGLPNDSRDAVVLQTLAPGTYTVRASGASGAGGLASLELYDAELLPGGSKLPYVAVRGRTAAGASVMLGGLGANGRGPRSYLLRALGPTLGLPGQLANPALIAVRDGLLVGSNDDWDAVPADATAVNTATTRVAAFPLPAGSRDSALVLTGNLHNGAHLAQVGGGETASGIVLLELHDLDAARPTAFAPIVVSPPPAQTVAVGAPLMLKAIAHGTEPLVFQWRKDGVNLPGLTASTLTIPAAATTDGGAYSVVVSNAFGTATSLPGVVVVQGTTAGLTATQAATGGGYAPGANVTITNTLGYGGTASSLGWSVTLPPGWTFVSDSGSAGDVKPLVGASGALEWAWTAPPPSPVTFTYTVSTPAGDSGDKTLSALAIVRSSTSPQVQTIAPSPNPLTIVATPRFHAGDTSGDSRISLLELTRMIELYNTRNGSVRTGAYAVATTVTEDGFEPVPTRAPGTAVTLTRHHSADTRGATVTAPRDGALNLLELTRVIELYNYRSGTTRTGQYHVDPAGEDGFNPGP